MHSIPPLRRPAFTLTEVMVAAAIFTLIATGIYASNLMALKTSKNNTCDMIAHGAAMNICNQVAASGYLALVDKIPAGAVPALRVSLMTPLHSRTASDAVTAVFDDWQLEHVNDPVGFDYLPVPLDFVKRPGQPLPEFTGLNTPAGGTGTSTLNKSERGTEATPANAAQVRVSLARSGGSTANCVKVTVRLRYSNAHGGASEVTVSRLVGDVAANAGYNS